MATRFPHGAIAPPASAPPDGPREKRGLAGAGGGGQGLGPHVLAAGPRPAPARSEARA